MNHILSVLLTESHLAVGKAETALFSWIVIPSQVLGALDSRGVIVC